MVPFFDLCDFFVQNLKPITYKTLIKAFGVEELEDFVEKMSGIGSMCLIAIDGSDTECNYENPGNRTHINKYNIIVCRPVDTNKADALYTAVKDCKLVTKEIEGYLLRESENSKNPFGLNRVVDDNSFKFNGVGPIGDNFYGSMLSFSLKEPENFTKTADLWL